MTAFLAEHKNLLAHLQTLHQTISAYDAR